jgi:hypothetical protein
MIVQVVEEFGRLVEFVYHSTESKHPFSSQDIERVPFGFEEVFEERHSGVG